MSALDTAIRLAAAAHRDQTDKAGQPYVLHPIRVMARCQALGMDAMIVAVLHDVVEDTTVTLATINSLFGDTISNAVDALTKRHGESYDDFLDRIKLNPLARLVKMQDIADNTDPDRLAVLTDTERARLTAKYEAALWRLI